MYTIKEESFTRIYLDLIKLVSGKGTLEGKTRDLVAVQLVLLDPERSLLFFDKNWKWCFQEAFDRMSGIFSQPPEYANPGLAYKYRSVWEKKLEEEGGKVFCYSYGQIFTETVPAAIRQLKRQRTSREAIIPVWEKVHLTSQSQFNRRPCTLTLHFLIRNKELHAFVNMRSNDIINLLPYDVFHHTLLQRYIAKKLELGLGSYYHFASHMYYPKKREREGRQFLERTINKLEESVVQQYRYKVSTLVPHLTDQDFTTAYDILYRDGFPGQSIRSSLIRNMTNFLLGERLTNEFVFLKN